MPIRKEVIETFRKNDFEIMTHLIEFYKLIINS